MSNIVTHLVNQSKINPKIQDLEMLIAEVEYYIEPLADYLNKVDDMQRKELKGFLGGGADNKFWRSFQKVIAETRDDFLPEGLSEYIENETKQYNTESREYLTVIEEHVKTIIANALQSYYGENWIIKGLPKNIYKTAKKMADDKNYELLSNDEEAEIDTWDCITLANCREIVTYSHNWSEIFESIVTRPEDVDLSNKEQKTEWMSTMSKEINKISKATYSVPKMTFELISSIYDWLVGEK